MHQPARSAQFLKSGEKDPAVANGKFFNVAQASSLKIRGSKMSLSAILHVFVESLDSHA